LAKELGIGLIGTGWVAEAHAGNFSQIPGCAIVGVSSRKKARSQWFINHLGLRDAQPCTGCDQLLGIEGLDVAVICTPHPAHPAQTIAAARAGKHVVIEKPVALNREDLKRMVSAVNKANVLTSVCFELRWIGLFKNIRAMIDQGLIGRAYYGECSYFHGIGPWYDQYRWNIKKRMAGDAALTAGCHALDGLIWLMGSRVKEVAAMSNTSPGNPLKYEYDPNSVFILKFENGAMGKVATSIECRQPYLFPVLIQGDRGTVWNDKISSLTWPGLHKQSWAQVPTDLPESGDVHDHPYLGQLTYFVECIRNRRRPHNDLNDSAHVHEVMFAAQEAIRSRRVVKVRRTSGT